MARLFISQDRLDNWAAEDRVKVEGDRMTLSGDGRAFKIATAVRFMEVSGGGEDVSALVGKVRTIDQLEAEGGEHYMDSVIIGDTAYDVQQGFLGVPIVEPTDAGDGR